MPRLPTCSGREAVAAFERAGWKPTRKRGDHIILTKPGTRYNLSISDHRALKAGLLRSLIRKAGLTVEQFTELLKN